MSDQGAQQQQSYSAYQSPFGFQYGTGQQAQGGEGGQQFSQQQIYIDPETIKHQKTSSLSLLDNQVAIIKDRSKAEYENQKQAILMKAEHELGIASATIEQSKSQSLFALDQQHQQRKLEIEQRAQEQKMQIESTASQLSMQAQQQRLQREMQEKLAKIQQSIPAGNSLNLFGNQQQGGQGQNYYSYQPSQGTTYNLGTQQQPSGAQFGTQPLQYGTGQFYGFTAYGAPSATYSSNSAQGQQQQK